jgi:hypothetical protein
MARLNQLIHALLLGFVLIVTAEESGSLSKKHPRVSASTIKPVKIIGSDDEELKPLFKIDGPQEVEIIGGRSLASGRRSKGSRKSSARISRNFDTSSSFYKVNLDLPKFQELPQEKVIFSNNQVITEVPEKKFSSFGDFDDLAAISNLKQISGDDVAILPGTVITSSTSAKIASGTIIASSANNVAPGTVIARLDVPESTKGNPISTPLENKLIAEPVLVSPFNDPIIENNITINDSTSTKPAKTTRIKKLDEEIIESLSFDTSYLGPKITLNSSVTNDYIKSTLIPYFKSGKILDKKSAYSVLRNILF